ncbi:metalloendopeptidase OMA1, mitochondrial-like [Lineus longissimus]|uniref:metalloendopeptidase OMA1, mitochondrial-like n=1 Tax=Lineus longissimus TaxID=88925 RepID=UPI002B4ED45F
MWKMAFKVCRGAVSDHINYAVSLTIPADCATPIFRSVGWKLTGTGQTVSKRLFSQWQPGSVMKNCQRFKPPRSLSCKNVAARSYSVLSTTLRRTAHVNGGILRAPFKQCIALPGTVAQHFRTSSRRPIHPLFWIILRPLAKVGAVLTGRGFRKWWQGLPKDRRTYLWEAFKAARPKIYATLAVITLGFTVNYVVHVKEAPITGRKRFIAVTDDQYLKIAQFEADLQIELLKSHFLAADHPASQAVLEVATRLYHTNQDIPQVKNLTFSVAVVDEDDTVNAFVLPTGHIFVFTGLLKAMHNEDQLAVILGHEMAHAILSHGAEQLSFAHLIDFFVIATMAAIWALLPNDGWAIVTQWFYNKVVAILLDMPYSRKLEVEADEVGLQLAAKACFDVREAPAFWTYMTFKNEELPDWLSTHPNHSKRAEALDEIVPEAIRLRASCDCGQLPKEDPRNRVEKMKQELKEQMEHPDLEKPTPVLPLDSPKG